MQIGLRAGLGQALALGDIVRVGQLQHAADFFFGSAVEDRRGEGHTLGEFLRHLDDFLVGQVLQMFGLATGLVVQLVHELAQLGHRSLLLQHVANAQANALACPAQVHFQHLTDVHP
jgi:hypothetical protein